MTSARVNLNILVVDDNHHMRIIVVTLLRALGIREVRECADGADAFSIMKSWRPDVIIIDQHMQPISGLEFAQLLRRGSDVSVFDTPMILLTAHTERSTIEAARDAGIDEILAKPLAANALLQRLTAVLEHRRPFLRTKSYVGPDRRRRKDPNYRGPMRRSADKGGPPGDEYSLD